MTLEQAIAAQAALVAALDGARPRAPRCSRCGRLTCPDARTCRLRRA